MIQRPILLLAFLSLVGGTADATVRLVPRAFPTIQEAEDASQPGDTIKIIEGEYREQVQVDVPNLMITGVCATPGSVVVDGGAGMDTLFDVQAPDVSIRCLTTQHGGGVAIRATASSGLSVKKVTILHPSENGIEIIRGVDFHIVDTEIRGSGFRGLVTAGTGNGPGLIESTDVSHADDACFRLENVQGIVVSSSHAFQCEDSYGLFLVGDGNRIEDSSFSYAEYGFYVEGNENEVTGNELVSSGFSDDALLVIGDDNSIQDNQLTNAFFAGIAVTGNRNKLVGNQVTSTVNDFCIDYEGDDAEIASNSCSHTFYGITVLGDNALLSANALQIVGFDAFTLEGDNPVLSDNSLVTGGGYNAFEVICAADCSQGELRGNRASGVSDDYSGFFVAGATDGLQIVGNQASYAAEFGFELECNGCWIEANDAHANGSEDEAGFLIQGSDNSIGRNASSDNAGAGYRLEGDHNALLGNTARANLLEGFLVAAGLGNLLELNISKENRAEGIDNQGFSTLLIGNRATNNRTDCTNDGTVAVNDANVCADGRDFSVPGSVGN